MDRYYRRVVDQLDLLVFVDHLGMVGRSVVYNLIV
jgi:hypothetical protein